MKDIKNYEGLYAITSCGRVWSYRSNKFLTPVSNGRGYLKITLSKDGQKKQHYIHRLVGEAYIANPNNLPQINHKNEIKTKNYINNLEWCDNQYNNDYSHSKAVYCVELDKTFHSIVDAANELKIDRGNISRCCRGQRKTVNGYHFKYWEV